MKISECCGNCRHWAQMHPRFGECTLLSQTLDIPVWGDGAFGVYSESCNGCPEFYPSQTAEEEAAGENF